MRTRIHNSGWLCLALLAAGLLLSAPPAAAAGSADGSGFSRFSVRLYGGYSNLKAADVNEGSDGYFELLEIYALSIPEATLTGGYKPVHDGLNAGVDFIYHFTRNIGLGLGVGYLRSAKTSHLTLADVTGEIELTGTPAISAMPVRLGVFFTVPVAPKINLTGDVGAALYTGLKLDAALRIDEQFEAEDPAWAEMSLVGKRSSDIGYQGSLGFEYMFSPKMGFFVEAVGRYARFKTFETVTGLQEDSYGYSDTTEGKLYLVTYTGVDPVDTWSTFTIEDEEPVSSPPEIVFTEPKIDLSGFSLQAGIRIRF